MTNIGDPDDEVPLTGGGRTTVSRRGGVVFREAGPWSVAVLGLLRHLEVVGFAAAPRVVGSGFDRLGRETVTFVEGGFVHPGPWRDDAVAGVGAMLRALHDATSSFVVPQDAIWRPWHGRGLGGAPRVIGHCDTGPWNIVERGGVPFALIDWEVAGPVDARVELAQACWLNAQLHGDVVAEMCGLPSVAVRAAQFKAIVDGYGLARRERAGLVDLMIEVAVSDAASQVADVTPASDAAGPLWAVSWRVTSAAWMARNRRLLERAVQG